MKLRSDEVNVVAMKLQIVVVPVSSARSEP
jgi:hypothetical protein